MGSSSWLFQGNSALSPVLEMKKHVILYLSLLLLVNASDVELNPGPRTPKYPCQICSRAVTWLLCDDRQQWYHADCMHMSTPVYMSLNNVSWHCVNCGMPNFSTSLFESSLLILRTLFPTEIVTVMVQPPPILLSVATV